jgi:hypothetical protein
MGQRLSCNLSPNLILIPPFHPFRPCFRSLFTDRQVAVLKLFGFFSTIDGPSSFVARALKY